MGITFSLSVALCALLPQLEVEVHSARAADRPVVVSAGFLPASLAAGRIATPVRVIGRDGSAAPGIAIPGRDQSVLRWVAPRLDAGKNRYTVVVVGGGVPPPPPVVTRDAAGGFSLRCENVAVAVEPDGNIALCGSVVSLIGQLREPLVWSVTSSDAFRIVLTGNALVRGDGDTDHDPLTLRLDVTVEPAASQVTVSLFVTRCSGVGGSVAVGLLVPAIAVAAVHDVTSAGAAAAALSVDLVDVVARQREPDRQVVADGSGACFSWLRSGPCAPRSIRVAEGGVALCVGSPGEDLMPGRARVLTLVWRGDHAVPADVVTRPLTWPTTPWPAGLRPPSPVMLVAPGPWRAHVDRCLMTLRTDPEAGLGTATDDHGDWRSDGTRWGNLAFDTGLGLLLRWFDAGDPTDARAAEAAVCHLLLHDVDAAASGLAVRRGLAHRGGIDAGENWVDGLLAVARWRDEPWMTAAVAGVAERQLATLGALMPGRDSARACGWGLHALAAFARNAGTPAAAGLARAVAQRVVVCQTATGHVLIDRSHSGPDYRVVPAVDGGVVVPGLRRVAEVVGGPAGAALRTAAERLATAVTRDAFVAAGGRTRASAALMLASGTARVVHRSGHASPEETLFLVTGLGKDPESGAGSDVPAGPERMVRDALDDAAKHLAAASRPFPGKSASMVMRALAQARSAGATR